MVRVKTFHNDGRYGYVDMDSGPAVVVSETFEDCDKLVDILNNNGVEAHTTANAWPRDRFICYKNNYINALSHPELGEGGNYVFGDDFVLVSKGIIEEPYLAKKGLKKVVKRLEHFFECLVYPIESRARVYERHNGIASSPHIDLSIMNIPIRNMLLVDWYQYKHSQAEFSKIARKHDTEIVPIEPGQEYMWLPLNCLVLEKEESSLVIANEFTPEFLEKLSESEIDFETVRTWRSHELGGSIRCRTNEASNSAVFSELAELEELKLIK